MRNRRFEWDDAKAAANLAKHGVAFEEAVGVFADPYALEHLDPDPDEERTVTLGMSLLGQVLVVVSTERGGRIRIISARPATKGERKRYADE